MALDVCERLPRYTRGAILRRSLMGAGGIGAGLTLASQWPAIALGETEHHATMQAYAASRPANAATSALANANLDLAFRLHGTLSKAGRGANLLFSPLSISIALAMAYNGASGATRAAMGAALSLKGMSIAEVNRANLALLDGLRGRDTKVALSLADSIWLRQGLTVAPQFGTALHTYYGAVEQAVNFDDPRAPGTINAWVKARTQGLIPSIVKSIDPATVMYLINALYFKAPWTLPFEKNATSTGPFTVAGGGQKSVRLMSKTADFGYLQASAYQAIRLPYASGKISMYIVLPAAGSSLASVMQGLTPAAWTALVGNLRTMHGSITMPRFSVDYNQALKPALSMLGMSVIFDPKRATFTDMILGRNAYITEVQHRAIMKVDEAGTLAAAVTSVGVGITAVQQNAFAMIVNRPFFCAIQDDVSGTLLFMGAITNPDPL